MNSIHTCIFLTLLVTMIHQAFAESVDGRPDYICKQLVNASIEIDGHANEVAWNNANVIPHLSPTGNTSSKQDNLVKLLWDNQYIYFVATIKDEHIHSTFSKRDEHVYKQDAFEIFIQPDRNDKNYVELQWSPKNVIFDYLLLHPGQNKRRAIGGYDIKGMKSAVSKNATGWTVEGAIPFNELNIAERMHIPPQHGDSWRFLIARCDINETKTYLQTAWPKTQSVHDNNNYANLIFKKVEAGEVRSRQAAAQAFVGLAAGKHWSLSDNIFEVKAYSNTCQYKKSDKGWKSTNKWGALERRPEEKTPPGLKGTPVVFLHPNRKDGDPTIIEIPVSGYTKCHLWLRMTDQAAETIHSGLADGVTITVRAGKKNITQVDVIDEHWQLVTFTINSETDGITLVVEQGPISLNSDHCLAAMYLLK